MKKFLPIMTTRLMGAGLLAAATLVSIGPNAVAAEPLTDPAYTPHSAHVDANATQAGGQTVDAQLVEMRERIQHLELIAQHPHGSTPPTDPMPMGAGKAPRVRPMTDMVPGQTPMQGGMANVDAGAGKAGMGGTPALATKLAELRTKMQRLEVAMQRHSQSTSGTMPMSVQTGMGSGTKPMQGGMAGMGATDAPGAMKPTGGMGGMPPEGEMGMLGMMDKMMGMMDKMMGDMGGGAVPANAPMGGAAPGGGMGGGAMPPGAEMGMKMDKMMGMMDKMMGGMGGGPMPASAPMGGAAQGKGMAPMNGMGAPGGIKPADGMGGGAMPPTGGMGTMGMKMDKMMGMMDKMMGGMGGPAMPANAPMGGAAPGSGMGGGAMPTGGEMGMMGMMKDKMMGGMGVSGGSSMTTTSALPGFPGASHLYHVGSTGFFLDHPQHIALSTEQQMQLNQIKEQAALDKASADRGVQEAEQDLWALTAADQPDNVQIEAKVAEIEKLKGNARLRFIGAVGSAARILSDQQRSSLTGFAPPSPAASVAPAAAPMPGGMTDM